MQAKYMMATKATHIMGDLSSETPDLCVITSEDKENYIGCWKFGAGFMDVKFPKETTRELNSEERDQWNGELYTLSGMKGVIKIDGATNDVPIPNTPFIVYTKNSTFKFGPVEADGLRTCFRNGISLDYRVTIHSLVIGKSMMLNGYYTTSRVIDVVNQ